MWGLKSCTTSDNGGVRLEIRNTSGCVEEVCCFHSNCLACERRGRCASVTVCIYILNVCIFCRQTHLTNNASCTKHSLESGMKLDGVTSYTPCCVPACVRTKCYTAVLQGFLVCKHLKKWLRFNWFHKYFACLSADNLFKQHSQLLALACNTSSVGDTLCSVRPHRSNTTETHTHTHCLASLPYLDAVGTIRQRLSTNPAVRPKQWLRRLTKKKAFSLTSKTTWSDIVWTWFH